MGFLDLFQRQQKYSDGSNGRKAFSEFTTEKSNFNEKRGPVVDIHPKSFADIETVIDLLRDGRQVVLYLGELTESTAFRVLDILSGAIFALKGGVLEIQKNVYLFSPSGVESR